jgi:hypothetical protein
MGECFSCTEPHYEPEYAAATWNRRAANAPADPALLALAKLGAEVLRESDGFQFGLSGAAIHHIALGGAVLDHNDVGMPSLRPGIADAIARLLAPDGAASEGGPMDADTLDRARDAALADTRRSPDLSATRDRRDALADVAAAAVALVGEGVYGHTGQFPEDNDGYCVGCAAWLDGGILHADDCPAVALEAAIRRLAGEVQP